MLGGYSIGPRISIEGEAEFRSAISKINANLRTLDSAMKLTTSEFDKNDKSVKNLTAQNKALSQASEDLKSKIAQQSEAIKRATEKYGESTPAVQGWQRELNKAKTQLNETERAITANEKAISEYSKEQIKAAKNSDEHKEAAKRLKGALDTVKIAVTAVMGAIVLSGKAAIDYESAFAGVRKTVSATEPELQAMSDSIRQMSKDIPVASKDLAVIAENAGQLGIKNDKIIDFTRTIADLGVATNLTGEEAAQTLAKFANITQMPQEEFGRLGSTIVDLGNNFATTEADIASMALRLAGAGKQAGMTEAEILAFATALSSVGVEAESGGSAFSKVFTKINVAVQTNSAILKDYAKVAGLTVEQFKNSFNSNASEAVIKFVEGLGKAGKESVVILQDMELKEVRLQDALLRTAGAGDVMRSAVETANGAWQENTALTKEAEQRYETTASQLQLLKNNVIDAAIEIGNGLTPQIKDFAHNVKNADLQPIINGFKWIISNGALIGSIAVGIGVGMATWNIAQTINAVVQAMQVWKGAMDAAKIAQVGLNVAMASNPIGAVITLVATLTAGLIAYKTITNDTKSATEELTEKIEEQNKAYEDNVSGIEKNKNTELAKVETSRLLTDELYKLNEQLKDTTTTEEKATEARGRMKSISEQLQQIMPELRLEFNKETGVLITQRDEVDKLTTSYKNLAIAKAYQAKMDVAAQKLIDAKENEKKATENLNKLTEERDNLKINSMSGWLGSANLENEIQDTVKIITQSWQDVANTEKEIETLSKKVYEYSEYSKTASVTTKDLSDKTNDLGNAYTGVGVLSKEAAKLEKEAAAAAKKGAKEAEKAEKEKTKQLEKERDKQFKDLKFNLDMGYITEAKYYEGLEILRDGHFEKGTDEWQKYTLEIYNFQKKTFDDIKKDIETTFSEITKAAESEYNALDNKRKTLETKLKGYAQLFEKTNVKIKGYYDGEQDLSYSVVNLGNLEKSNKELLNYKNLLLEVKERGAGTELFDLFRDMSVDEAIENAEAILKLPQEEFKKFTDDLKTNRELSANISSDFYSDEAKALKTEYADKVLEELGSLTEKYSLLGEDYASAMGDGFMQGLGVIFANARSEVTKQLNSLNSQMGAGTNLRGYKSGDVVNSTYAPNIVINGATFTPNQMTAAASRQYKIDKMKGFII